MAFHLRVDKQPPPPPTACRDGPPARQTAATAYSGSTGKAFRRRPGTLRHSRRRQTVGPVAQKNLNSRLGNRLHRDGRSRLNRRLSWFKCTLRVRRHMRIPNLKDYS
jgi:hypothetical protein